MNRIWNILSTRRLDEGEAAGSGGGSAADGAGKPDAGAGQPAADDKPPTPAAPDPVARRNADFDKYKWDDNLRGVASQYLDHFAELDAAQQATLIELGLSAQRRAAEGNPPERGEGAKGRKAAVTPAADDDATGQSSEVKALEKQIAAQQAKLDELLGAKRREEAARQTAAQKNTWKAEVEAALKDVPALEKLMSSPARRRAMTAQALGYVAEYQEEHGGSRTKALKAFLKDMTELAADSAGVAVSEWLERKAADQGAASSDGEGRPPAQTSFKPAPANLESGQTLARALAATGGR